MHVQQRPKYHKYQNTSKGRHRNRNRNRNRPVVMIGRDGHFKALSLLFGVLAAATAPLLGRPTEDTMIPNQTLTDGQTLISNGEVFELGFFSPSSTSTKRYLGIWFYGLLEKTVVWVANRDAPLNTSNGTLSMSANGNLLLYEDDKSNGLWSTGTIDVINPVLRLLDTGNLVLTGGSYNSTIWQSFDYPSDTFMAGMKIGRDFRTNIDRKLVSWRSSSDPSSGDFHYQMEVQGLPEVVLWQGSRKIFRTGPWNGLAFSSRPDMATNSIFHFSYVSDQNEVYYSYETLDRSTLSRTVMNATGYLERDFRSPGMNAWQVLWNTPQDACDTYAYCGGNGICSSTYTPFCNCLQGFAPSSVARWNLWLYSGGCVRRTALDCSSDEFLKIKNIKLPETTNATADANISVASVCRHRCSENCSCMAYAMINQSGCVTWPGDLVDMRLFPQGGDVLYLRLAASELAAAVSSGGKDTKKKVVIIVIAAIVGLLSLIGLGVYLWWRRRVIRRGSTVPSFDFPTIKAATDDFSEYNKLGEGGFGIVYKGRLGDGQDIAVKRLLRTPRHGPNQFRNELELIANLQHRNLVRLLGCCVEGDERILILEYMENRSLDAFIYDHARSALINWQKRMDIIVGIARGLQYLHEDSNLNVVHRDLKPNNILLDGDMNPKISDFGVSRIVVKRDGVLITDFPVGTMGYMAPEYKNAGIFSVKSDIFGFGVIVLEILSGRKNTIFNLGETTTDLLGEVYMLWKVGRSLEILDAALSGSYPVNEALRCIQLALLCVEENSEDRPTMSEVLMMLASEAVVLNQPKQPYTTGVANIPRDRSFSTKQLTVTFTGR